MTLYLDVIWALNFLFDSLLLYLTGIILKRNLKLWRIFLGGFVGSLIILLTLLPIETYSGHPITKLSFSVVMVLFVFGYKRLSYFFNGLVTFYLITFLIGGALIGVHYFISFDAMLSSAVLLESTKGFGDPISWLFVLLGFPLAWHFSKRSMDKIEMTKISYEENVDVFIRIAGLELQLRGLIDSGNQLYDPISKMPVMVVSLKKHDEVMPEAIIRGVTQPEKLIEGNLSLPSEWESKMRIIPYKVVGQEHQLIVAIKPDELLIKKEKESIPVKKGLVSFTMQQLSSDDLFQCIVHPKMVTGLKKTVAS